MSSYSSQYRAPYPSEQPFARTSPSGTPARGFTGSDYEGKRAAQLSIAYGVIGMFVFWFVFGPLAISNANKAERLGEPAAGGRLLGWVSIILGVLALLVIVGYFMLFAAFMSTAWESGMSV